MICNYKEQEDFFSFANSTLGVYDEDTLRNEIIVANSLISNIKTNLTSKTPPFNQIQQLSSIFSKLPLENLNHSFVCNFFDFIIQQLSPENFGFLNGNHDLFTSLLNLLFSLKTQSCNVTKELDKFGLIKLFQRILENDSILFSDPQEKQFFTINIFDFLAVISHNSKEIHDRIVHLLPITYFKKRLKFLEPETEDEEKYHLYKLIASFTTFLLSQDEIIDCFDIFKICLLENFSRSYKAVAIGFHQIVDYIGNPNRALKLKIKDIYPLLLERIEDDDTLCEYTCYITIKLIHKHIEIPYNPAQLESYMESDNIKVQRGTIFFFFNLLRVLPKEHILSNLNLPAFLIKLHEIYNNSSYSIKMDLSHLILAYLNFDESLKEIISQLLKDGLIETMIDMMQIGDIDVKLQTLEIVHFVIHDTMEHFDSSVVALFSECSGFDTINSVASQIGNIEPNDQIKEKCEKINDLIERILYYNGQIQGN